MDLELLKKLLNLQENSSDEATIHIYGIIGLDEAYWDEGTNNVAFALVSLIRDLEKTYKRINIRINSPGGYIDDGLAIYNAIKFSTAETHTYNDGIVASMAGIIFIAGQKTHAPKTSVHHIHSASTITRGNIKDHEESINQLKVYEDTLAIAIGERIGKTSDEVKEMWFDGNEHYFTGEEANELGLIDFLEDIEVEVPANVENMTYQQMFNLYKENGKNKKSSKKTNKKKTVMQNLNNGLKSVFAKIDTSKNINKNSNKNQSKKITNMKDLTMLIALLAIDYIVVNEDGKAIMDRAQVEKVEAEMKRLTDFEDKFNQAQAEKINLEKDLKEATDSVAEKDEKIAELTTSVTEKDEKIAELTAKLEEKPAGGSTKVIDKGNGGGADDKVDWKTIDDLDHNKEADESI